MLQNFSSLIDNINIHYYGDFFDQHKADKYYNILEHNLVYNSAEDSKVKIFGKEYEISRKQVAYGDTGVHYEFAGTTVEAKSWNDQTDIVCRVIKNIKKHVEMITMKKFNFCLINRYKDGDDKIGFHSDDETHLGNDVNIAGVSFGACRDVSFIPTNFLPQKMPKNITFQLDHGSLFVIRQPTNTFWKHSIPKRTNITTPRISLTFRYIYS